jgi:hypothetical protein
VLLSQQSERFCARDEHVDIRAGASTERVLCLNILKNGAVLAKQVMCVL